jgi:hypothetical protein
MPSSQPQNSDEPSGLLYILVSAFAFLLAWFSKDRLQRPHESNQIQDSTSNQSSVSQNPSSRPIRVFIDSIPPAEPITDQQKAEARRNKKREELKAILEWTAAGIALGLLAINILLWCSTIDSNRINRESLESVQRAFVIVEDIRFNRFNTLSADGTPVPTWRFYPLWKNAGNTSVIDAIQYATTENLSGEPSEEQFIGSTKNFFEFPIGPKALQPGAMKDIPDSLLESARSEQPGNGKIFAWGWLVYRDVLPNTPIHVTEYCTHLVRVLYAVPRDKNGKLIIPAHPQQIPDTNVSLTWSPCMQHNCIDEYCKDYKNLVSLFPK